MAKRFDILPDENGVPPFMTGEDKQLELTMDADDDGTVPDVSSWTLEWSMRKTQTSSGAAILSKSTDLGGVVVSGVYDPDHSINQQKVLINFADTDTALLKGNVKYAHSLKRMDDTNEVVLMFGDFYLGQVTER